MARGPIDSALNDAAEASGSFFAWLYRVIAGAYALTPESWTPGARVALMLGVFFFAGPWLLGRILPALRNRVGRWFRRLPTLFGQSRWAKVAELRRAGMLEPGGRFLGRIRDPGWFKKPEMMFMHGEGNLLTIAAQGAGKTTGLVIPTLVTYRAGSVIVTDPSGEITAQTKRLRSSIGPVVVLNPWAEEFKRDPSFKGAELGDDGFNPLQVVDDTPEGRSNAATLAALLLPDMPGEEPMWRTEARTLLEWAMLFQVQFLPPEQRTLPGLRHMLADSNALMTTMKAMVEGKRETGLKGRLQTDAANFYSTHSLGAGKQLAGYLGLCRSALKIYDDGSRLGDHVARTGFQLSSLKGDDRLTVFLICPPGHLVGDDRKWLNLVLALITQEIGRPGRARETLLLVDEFPALGFLPNLLPAIEQFRKAGLRAHLIAQNVGQILQTYDAEGFRRMLGLEYKQFFRITDPDTAKFLSEWLGQRTATSQTVNAQGEVSVSEVGIPLIRPDELAGLRRDEQVLVLPGNRAVFGEVYPFFKNERWRRLIDPNPYRGR